MKLIDNVIYSRDPEMAGVEICRVHGSRHVFPDHAHEGIYAIGLMESGGSYCLGLEKSDSLVHAGQIALINPSQVHSGVPVPGKRISYCMIYFDFDLMDTIAAEISGKPSAIPEFSAMIVEDARLWRLLKRLCKLIQGAGGRLEKESAMMDAVAYLVSSCGNVKSETSVHRTGGRVLRQARAFLSENLDRKMSLADAARTEGLSRYHFLRAFKKSTGLPPHLFRTMQRIERAKALLRDGCSLAQTALAAGFSDQSHFTNTFRKYTGATPGQYLCNHHGGRLPPANAPAARRRRDR